MHTHTRKEKKREREGVREINFVISKFFTLQNIIDEMI